MVSPQSGASAGLKSTGAQWSAAEYLDQLVGIFATSPENRRQFNPSEEGSAQKLGQDLAATLAHHRAEAQQDPFHNPVLGLALDVVRRLDQGEIKLDDVESLIQRLVVTAFGQRVDRLSRYVGERRPEKNDERLDALFRRIALNGKLPFASYKARLEAEIFGIVITAHPTFSLAGRLVRTLSALAAGETPAGQTLDPDRAEALLLEAAKSEHRSDDPVDLMVEHELSLDAITNILGALRRVYGIALDVARDLYPAEWTHLSPKLVTVASWVGYDLDGRSDITWTVTLHTRLIVQLAQLERYLDLVQGIRADSGGPEVGEGFDAMIELVESRLALAIKEIRDEIAVFGAVETEAAKGYEQIQRIAKRMRDGLSLRLVEASHLVDLISRALEATTDDAVRRNLALLRAELCNHGLAMAHTHVRLNASQLHNAVGAEINLSAPPDDPAFKRSYIQGINALLDEVKPVTINFGTLIAERASAPRLFMVVAQMLKYVDTTTPVRFLIAESDTTLTVLVALYFAKLFGIEDRIDISPLFETEKALERAVRIVRELLANPHYRAYVKERKRLCIQTGFSDAGRILGQTTAAAGMERLKLGLVDLLADEGLDDVQLVVFDTHGEAIGRGGHPESFEARLDYIMTPESQTRARSRGIALKQEVSFQGGDGYAYFMTPAIAYAAVSRILEHALEEPAPESEQDPFYTEWDYVVEFFATINQFNRMVMGDRKYAALLSMYGTNILYPAGSRSLTRQSDDPLDTGDAIGNPMQLRAISHNSILQQMGYLANTLGGVGLAIAKDPEGFVSLYSRSPRFRRLISMAREAWGVSDLSALHGYVELLDPGRWLARSARVADPERASELTQVSEFLERLNLHDRLSAIFRVFQRDGIAFERGLAALEKAGAGGSAIPAATLRRRDDLALLHGLRLALIRQLLVLAARIPDFSPQWGTTPQLLVRQIVHLQVEKTMASLQLIFPPKQALALADDFGEPATYRRGTVRGFERQHREIFEPMMKIYTLIRRISTGIIHTIGATG